MMCHPAEKSGNGDMTSSGRYDVSMRLSVRDPGLLWRMAAAKMLSIGGFAEEDVVDVLGPMEDPSIIDCIVMLVGPCDLGGCCFEDFAIAPVGAVAGVAGKARPARIAPGRGSPLFRVGGDRPDVRAAGGK